MDKKVDDLETEEDITELESKPRKCLSKKSKLIFSLTIAILLFFMCVFSNVIFQFVSGIYNPLLSNFANSCEFKIHFLDVGQADAIIAEMPGGELVVVDSGRPETKQKLLNYINKIMKKHNGTINYFIMTHPHEDHIGAAESIFNEYKVEVCYRPQIHSISEKNSKPLGNSALDSDNENYDNAILAMKLENCEVRYNSEMTSDIIGDNYKIEFLSPNVMNYSDENDYSPMLLLTCFERKILLTGDASELIEDEIIANYTLINDLDYLDIDILKVGHHGSKTSSSTNFLNIIKPEIGVISVGKNNQYGNPSEIVINSLISAGIDKVNLFRTDENGNIIIGINENSELHILTDNNEAKFICKEIMAGIAIIFIALLLWLNWDTIIVNKAFNKAKDLKNSFNIMSRINKSKMKKIK